LNKGSFILSASIAAALASTSALALPAAGSLALAGIHTAEAPRVTQTVDSHIVSMVQNSHLKFVRNKAPVSKVADSKPMNHLQLILQRSALRQAALTQLLADQHDPKSAKFHQWLTPQEFGDAFGVSDADIAAAKAWLVAQGFTVEQRLPEQDADRLQWQCRPGEPRIPYH
jgi:Pro-kumamolisin, activation domain.